MLGVTMWKPLGTGCAFLRVAFLAGAFLAAFAATFLAAALTFCAAFLTAFFIAMIHASANSR